MSISDEKIRSIRKDARDPQTVDMCNRALNGDLVARESLDSTSTPDTRPGETVERFG